MPESFFAKHATKDLIEYYNAAAAELGHTTITKFENREVAERRCDIIRNDLRKRRGQILVEEETVVTEVIIEAIKPEVIETLTPETIKETIREVHAAVTKVSTPLAPGEITLRGGTKRAVIYAKLSSHQEEMIPSTDLFPGGDGVDYAVKRLNEKLADAASPLEIRRSKEGKIVSYGLYPKA